MRVLYFHQHFTIPTQAGGTRSAHQKIVAEGAAGVGVAGHLQAKIPGGCLQLFAFLGAGVGCGNGTGGTGHDVGAADVCPVHGLLMLHHRQDILCPDAAGGQHPVKGKDGSLDAGAPIVTFHHRGLGAGQAQLRLIASTGGGGAAYHCRTEHSGCYAGAKKLTTRDLVHDSLLFCMVPAVRSLRLRGPAGRIAHSGEKYHFFHNLSVSLHNLQKFQYSSIFYCAICTTASRAGCATFQA